MAWNRNNTILEAGSTAEIDADVIFTSALVGLAIEYARNSKNWRVAMEPEIELDTRAQDPRKARTEKDIASMTKHNQLCECVNPIVRNYVKNDKFTLSWGFSPSYTAGGMIAGGEEATVMDGTLNPKYKEIARKYLTGAKTPSSRTDPWQMYIGRGAYCGLILNDAGDAVSAMSTVRTTLKENSNLYPHPLDKQVGDRWCPPSSLPEYANKDSAKQDVGAAHRTWIWGMIGNADVQVDVLNQGMNFYCGDDNRKGTDIVGYTHGLPRCVYECVRAGKGHPYEMSIGVKTFKLASCMGCTFFMTANGFTPSTSHVGKAESWAPLYHVLGNNPSELLAPLDDQHDQTKAFELANNRWADRTTTWMKDGAAAIAQAQGGASVTLRDNHVASLSSLSERLGKIKPGDEAQRRVCCNLLLDAFTWHKGDVDRVIDTLHTDAFQWWWDTDKRTTLENYTNPYTDEQLRSFADLKALELPAKAGR